MNKTVIKSIIFVLVLAIGNVIATQVTEAYESSCFILNIVVLNLAVIAAYFMDVLLIKKREYYVNNVILYVITYAFMAVEVIASIIFIALDLTFVTGLIIHLIVILASFIPFGVTYMQAGKANTLAKTDRHENVTKKAMIMDIEGLVGVREGRYDKQLEALADDLRYMPTHSNELVERTDKQLNAGIRVLTDESLSDEDFEEALKVVKGLVAERKKYLLLAD